jgi:hypothetical protein
MLGLERNDQINGQNDKTNDQSDRTIDQVMDLTKMIAGSVFEEIVTGTNEPLGNVIEIVIVIVEGIVIVQEVEKGIVKVVTVIKIKAVIVKQARNKIVIVKRVRIVIEKQVRIAIVKPAGIVIETGVIETEIGVIVTNATVIGVIVIDAAAIMIVTVGEVQIAKDTTDKLSQSNQKKFQPQRSQKRVYL